MEDVLAVVVVLGIMRGVGLLWIHQVESKSCNLVH